MNERQIIFLLGSVLGGVAGGCFGFARGMDYVMNDKLRNELIRLNGWLEGYKACLKREEKQKRKEA